jgi:hypothetical protein
MKISHIRCSRAHYDCYLKQSTGALSPEKLSENVKTFKPKILVSEGAGDHMSRNTIIKSQAHAYSSFNDTPNLGSPLRENGQPPHFRNASFIASQPSIFGLTPVHVDQKESLTKSFESSMMCDR